MKTASKYNRSEIMKAAHRLYKWNRIFNWSFGKCLASAWQNAKTKIRNEEIREANRIAEEARRAEYRKNIIPTHVGMDSLYRNRAYSGD